MAEEKIWEEIWFCWRMDQKKDQPANGQTDQQTNNQPTNKLTNQTKNHLMEFEWIGSTKQGLGPRYVVGQHMVPHVF